ncbi:MAG: hypothetical protein AAFV80_09375, partial [Bacteroidota bacterium]
PRSHRNFWILIWIDLQQISLDISSRFDKLAQVAIQHDYYDGANPPELSLHISPQSQHFFQRFGLKSKFQSGIFDIGFKKREQTNPFGKTDLSAEKISVLIFNDSAYFTHLSDLPFDRNEHIYYFNNYSGTAVDGQPLLHPEAHVNGDQLVQPVTGLFNYQLTDFEGETTWTLIDRFGNPIIDEKIIIPEGGKITFDLRDEPDGYYELQVHDAHLEIYKINELAAVNRNRQLFGVVDLFLSPDLAKDMAIMDSDAPQQPKFYIHFGARQYFWHYIIVSQTNANLFTDHKVNDLKGTIRFSQAESYNLGRQEAYRIRTEGAIPARQTLDYQFRLSFTKKQEGSRTFELDLPNADITSIKLDAESGKIYSDVFINV